MNNNSRVPEVTRRKMSESHKRMKMSLSHCENISKGLRGRKLSPEHCQKIKEAILGRYRNGWKPNKGRIFRPEQYESRSAMMTGRKLSEATKQKLRLAKLGKKQSPEAIEKTRRANIALNRKGPKSVKWKGGRHENNNGYILVMKPGHPHADRHGYVLEHRLVMEARLGHCLLPSEVVHHINGIKTDNRIENLHRYSSGGDHTGDHKRKR